MKNTLIAVGGIIAVSFFIGCREGGDDSKRDNVELHASHSASAAVKEGLVGLELNDGRRWKLDDHTRSVFSEMEALFLNVDSHSLEGEGLKKAGSSLEALSDKMIQGCTMRGAEHEQLHVYLMGFLPAIAALSETGRIEDAEKVTRYLERYDEYFE